MDSVLMKRRVVEGVPLQLALVCDGVGSTEYGNVASAYAAQMTGSWLDQLDSTIGLGLQLCEMLTRINHGISVRREELNVQMASTYSALLLYGSSFFVAHAGDSRIYQLAQGKAVLLTEDQKTGKKLTNYLGKQGAFRPYYNEGSVESDVFLLCSDGLYQRLGNEAIAEWMGQMDRRNLAHIIKKMVRAAVDKGETDNISAIAVICER